MQTWKAALDDKLGDSKPPPDFQKLLDQTHACEQTVVGKRGAVATMTKYRDMMCACKDTNCTKGVGGGGEMAKQEAANATLSDDDTKKVAQLYQEMQACMTKLTSGSGS
jgi:hypothetical protein